jgi:hypothetical protein
MNAFYRATAALLLGSVALPAMAADLPSMAGAPLAPAYAAPSPAAVVRYRHCRRCICRGRFAQGQ